MGKVSITHACGHEVIHDLFGPHKQRNSKAEWLATLPCRDCSLKDEQDEAAKLAATQGWPELVGSPKQVAWANVIRLKQVKSLHERLAKKRQALADAPSGPAILVLSEKMLELSVILLRDSDIAEWWIDGRDIPLEDLIASDPRFVLALQSADIHDWGSP